MKTLKTIILSLLMTTTALAQNSVGNPSSGYNCTADNQMVCQNGSENDQSSAASSGPSDTGQDSPSDDSSEGSDTGSTGTDPN